MHDQVDEVKQKTDIVSILGEYIQVKKAGKNYKALCPFHGEKTPSFMISPELQMYKCFGCGEAGDVFSFLQKFEGMDFGEALRFLAERAGVKLVSFKPGDRGEKEKLYEINNFASKFYNYILLNHSSGKAALNYLTKERKLSLETIKTFQLGYSPDVPNVLKRFLVDKKHFQTLDVEKLGLVINANGRILDKFRGRIIFPLLDHRGNIAGFTGRIMPGTNKELAKYVNSPESPVYHKSSLLYGLSLTKKDIKEANQAIIVEGQMDMVACWQGGVKNVVAVGGTAFTDDQVRLLNRFTKKIIMALDSDFAGDLAARRGIVVAQKQGLEILVATFGKYKDPDEAIKADPAGFRVSLEKAIGVWDFLINSIFSKMDITSGEGKAKMSREIVPVLASIPDKIVQAHYIEVVARKLAVPPAAVGDEVEKIGAQKAEEKIEQVTKPVEQEKGRRQLLEERLLTLAFQFEPEILLKENIRKLISTPLANRMVEEYSGYTSKTKTFSPAAFAEKLPKELVEGFAEMVLKDTEHLSNNPEQLDKELDLVLKELKIMEIHRLLEKTGVKIRQFEDEGEKDKLISEQKRFGELSTTLSKLEEGNDKGIILDEQ